MQEMGMEHGALLKMRSLPTLALMFFLTGCAPSSPMYWNVRELVLAPAPVIQLTAPDNQVIMNIDRQTVQKLFLAHRRITRAAGVQADLLIVDGDEPNAFAGVVNGRRSIAINTAMTKLIGDDIDKGAALLGHEAAHWAKGHGDTRKARSSTIQGIGTAIGVGLGMAGVPGAGYIAGVGADLIDASYSRDDEREADALGVEYMMASGFDPQGAVRLHEDMLKLSGALHIPFLSGHPSGAERLENLQKLIAAKKGGSSTE
jgi:predicted Zn-dependent protease